MKDDQSANQPNYSHNRHYIGRFHLTVLIFCTVCSGAFGAEELVASVNPAWALILLALTPLLWSLPIILMVSELNSAMPFEGGYYRWVKATLGGRWGFQEGWLTMCYTAVDLAIYPVLFVDYLSFFVPSLQGSGDEQIVETWLLRWMTAIIFIGVAFILQCSGIRAVGNTSLLFTVLIIFPFTVLLGIAVGTRDLTGSLTGLMKQLSVFPDGGTVAVGLATVLWLYSGWDNVATYAGEVKGAERSYPWALSAALILVSSTYLLSVIAGLAITPDLKFWQESAGWPDIATIAAGKWLGILMTSAALFSAWTLFNGQILYASRLPMAMASDGWLPSALAQASTRTGAPVVALALTCGVAALFAVLPFGDLVVTEMLLYFFALALEMCALIVLRIKRMPQVTAEFRIPFGLPGVFLMFTSPMILLSIVTIWSFRQADSGSLQLGIVAILFLSGVIMGRRKFQRKHPSPPNPD